MARWKAHCRLPISDNWTFFASSHGCGTIKRNLSKLAFSRGVSHFEHKFWEMGTTPAIRLCTVRLRNDVATTLPLEVFT